VPRSRVGFWHIAFSMDKTSIGRNGASRRCAMLLRSPSGIGALRLVHERKIYKNILRRLRTQPYGSTPTRRAAAAGEGEHVSCQAGSVGPALLSPQASRAGGGRSCSSQFFFVSCVAFYFAISVCGTPCCADSHLGV
jgi:hypothetical protein